MSDAPIETWRMVLIAKTIEKTDRYLHFATFKKKLETLELLSNLLLARRMLHPMPNVEARATVILFRVFLIYNI